MTEQAIPAKRIPKLPAALPSRQEIVLLVLILALFGVANNLSPNFLAAPAQSTLR